MSKTIRRRPWLVAALLAFTWLATAHGAPVVWDSPVNIVLGYAPGDHQTESPASWRTNSRPSSK